jgi:hypothetical protein
VKLYPYSLGLKVHPQGPKFTPRVELMLKKLVSGLLLKEMWLLAVSEVQKAVAIRLVVH